MQSGEKQAPVTPSDWNRYWNAIVSNGGEESAGGWCKDRWGISWQITPRVLMDALRPAVLKPSALSQR